MAKSISVSLPHDLTPAAVKQRLKDAIAEARTKHRDLMKDARETWRGDDHMDFTASAMGQSISGSLRIDPTHVHVTVTLPMLLALFASKLKPQIEAEGRKLLGK